MSDCSISWPTPGSLSWLLSAIERSVSDNGNHDLTRLVSSGARIVAAYQWGSRVLGTARPDSDYDFQVVYAMPFQLRLDEGVPFLDVSSVSGTKGSDICHETVPFSNLVHPLAPLRGKGNIDDIGKPYFIFENEDHDCNVSFVPLDDWMNLVHCHRYFTLDCLWVQPEQKLVELSWLKAPQPTTPNHSNVAACHACASLDRIVQRDDKSRRTSAQRSLAHCCSDAGVATLFAPFVFDVDILRRTVNWESKARWWSSRTAWDTQGKSQGVKYMYHAMRYKIFACALVENNGHIPDLTCAKWLWEDMKGSENSPDWNHLAHRFENTFERVKQELRDACDNFEVLYGWLETRRRFYARALPLLAVQRPGRPASSGVCSRDRSSPCLILQMLNMGNELPLCIEEFKGTEDTLLLMHRYTCYSCRFANDSTSRISRECGGTGLEILGQPCDCGCSAPLYRIVSWGIETTFSSINMDDCACTKVVQGYGISPRAPVQPRYFELQDGLHVVLRKHPVTGSWDVVAPWTPEGLDQETCWQVKSHHDDPNPVSLSELLWQCLLFPGNEQAWIEFEDQVIDQLGTQVHQCCFTFVISHPRHRFVARNVAPGNRGIARLIGVRNISIDDCPELNFTAVATQLNLHMPLELTALVESAGLPICDQFEYVSRLVQELNPSQCRGLFATDFTLVPLRRWKFENARWRSITDFTDFNGLGSLNWRPDLDAATITESVRQGRRHSLHIVSAQAGLNGIRTCFAAENDVKAIIQEFDEMVQDATDHWTKLSTLPNSPDGAREFAIRAKLLWCRQLLFALKRGSQGRNPASFFAACTRKELQAQMRFFRTSCIASR